MMFPVISPYVICDSINMKRVCLTSEQLHHVDIPQNSSRNGSGEESGVHVLSRLTEDEPMDSEGVTCPGCQLGSSSSVRSLSSIAAGESWR